MGYDAHEALPVWRLTFEDYPGLVVRVRPPSARALAAIHAVVPLLRRGQRVDLARALARLAGPFTDSLASWTLLNSGEPVPPTAAGLLRQDLDLGIAITSAWAAHTKPQSVSTEQPDTPAEETDLQLEAGLPMTPLDPDQVEVTAS